MRRTVATLLVVASPFLLTSPVRATDGGDPSAPATAVPAAAQPTPAAPAMGPAVADPPAAPAVTPSVPPVTTPVVAPSAAPAPVRPAAVRTPRAKAPSPAGVNDAVYAAKLQAELCAARQVFCGVGRNGRYPGS